LPGGFGNQPVEDSDPWLFGPLALTGTALDEVPLFGRDCSHCIGEVALLVAQIKFTE
jgi:hypothetical protein